MSKSNAIGATIISAVLALFLPFLSAIISVILVVKLYKAKEEAWARNIVVVNVVILIVNLAVTILAIGTGAMLINIA